MKDVFFRVHGQAFNSFIFTLLSEISALAEITELWEAGLLDSLILINVVPGISLVVRSLGNF